MSEDLNLFFEKHVPAMMAAVATGILWGVGFHLNTSTSNSLLSASAGVSSVFVGFLSMALPLTLSMNSEWMRNIRNTQYFPLMVRYMRNAIWLSLTVTVLSLAFLFHDASKPPILAAAWGGILVWSIAAFGRAARTFFIAVERDEHFK